MKITVNRDLCIGCGACVAICGEVFEIDKQGKSRVKVQKNLSCVREAKDCCPVKAIKVE